MSRTRASFYKTNTIRLFTEILDNYFDDIAKEKGWDATRTRINYENDYRNRIIPYLAEIDKPLESFTIEDFHKLNKRLHIDYEWGPERYEHMELLFLSVYEKGVELRYYEDKLYTRIRESLEGNLADPKVIKNRKEFYELKKSFTVEENIRIVRWLRTLNEELEISVGLDLGIAIMYLTGMRINEACALMFSDFDFIPSTKIPSVIVNKSTEIDSPNIKIGAKTVNGIRRIPISNFLFKLIGKKKKILLKAGKTEEDLKKMRIVTNSDGFPVCSRDLSKWAKDNFYKVCDIFSEKQEVALDFDIERQELVRSEGYEIEEVSPTAYVLRRNFATLIHSMGLTDGEEQYIFGHSVEEERRSYYNNPDILEIIYHKINRHPIFSLLEYGEVRYPKIEDNVVADKKYVAFFSAVAKEPFEPIEVKLKINGQSVSGSVSCTEALDRVSDNADIAFQLRKLYEAAWNNYKE